MEALNLEKEQQQHHNMLQTETAWPFPWKSCLIHFALFVTAELNNHAQEVFSWLYHLDGLRFWHKNRCLSTHTNIMIYGIAMNILRIQNKCIQVVETYDFKDIYSVFVFADNAHLSSRSLDHFCQIRQLLFQIEQALVN